MADDYLGEEPIIQQMKANELLSLFMNSFMEKLA